MSTRRRGNDPNVPPSLYLAAGIVLAILGAAAFVYLKDDETTRSGLMLWLLPLITTLFVAAKVDNSQRNTREHLSAQDERLADQDEALSTITHQTNGVLTERIKTAVSDALANRDAAVTLGATGNGVDTQSQSSSVNQ